MRAFIVGASVIAVIIGGLLLASRIWGAAPGSGTCPQGTVHAGQTCIPAGLKQGSCGQGQVQDGDSCIYTH